MAIAEPIVKLASGYTLTNFMVKREFDNSDVFQYWSAFAYTICCKGQLPKIIFKTTLLKQADWDEIIPNLIQALHTDYR